MSRIDSQRPLELLDCVFQEAVRFVDAGLRALTLDGSHFESDFEARDLETGADVTARCCDFKGSVGLTNAEIGGNLVLSGTKVMAGLDADGIEVGGNVHMQSSDDFRFDAEGEVCLLGAKIGGQWQCDGGKFANPSGDSINADRVEVVGNVFLHGSDEFRFEAEGEVRLTSARIGGVLSCIGGTFSNSNRIAINAEGIQVEGGVFMKPSDDFRFEAEGEVRLLGAKIKGQLVCDGGSFSNATGDAIMAQRAEIGDVFVGENATMVGEVCLAGVRVAGRLQWRDMEGECSVDLTHGHTQVLELEPNGNEIGWKLNGFSYQGLADPAGAHSEPFLALLKNADGGAFFPQPYRQLFRVLRDAGHAEDATEVAIRMRKEDLASKIENAESRLRKLWFRASRRVQSWVGYGYRPARAVGIAFAIVAVGTVLYGSLMLDPDFFSDVIAPTDAGALLSDAYTKEGKYPRGYPGFSACMYTLDLFMPIIDLGQASSFRPQVHAGWDVRGWLLTGFGWFLTLSGALLSALFAGAVSGVMRRIESDT